MNNTLLIIVFALLGVLGRTITPYLQALKDNPNTPFDRKFLIPPIVSVVIAVITLPLILSALPADAWLSNTIPGFVTVFVSAWGLTDIARAGQKVVAS
jgi:hypothetical protein